VKAALRLAAGLITLLGGTAVAAPEPVRIDSGLVAGTVEDGIAAWRSIPYAAPPVGPLRWREPQPAASWQGVRQATSFSPTCMQASSWDKQPRSEDCLTLSVWAPEDYSGKKLPVMVWIHGGGLHSGSGSQPSYLGDRLPRHGVILVTFNYRLGIFGFFSHPELTAESPFHASGNQGQLDQIAALQWVQRNIAAFGGDPARVTIFGESAGSGSVRHLIASPLTEGLFQAAIGESGADYTQRTKREHRAAVAEERGKQFAESAGAGSLAALRALPAETLSEKPWKPEEIADGHVEIGEASEAYAAHRQRDVPLLVGWNADEGVDLAGDMQNLTPQGFHEMLAGWFQPRPIPSLFDTLYPLVDESKVRFMQDSMGAAMWNWASEQVSGGARSPAYAYYFLHVPPEPFEPCTYGCRAGHGAEIRYVFGHLDQDRAWRPEDRELGEHILDYWTNFAKTGNPNGPGLPVWPKFDGKPQTVLRLGTAAEIAERGAFPDYSAWLAALRGP